MVWPDRFASSGFAWDCLWSRMKSGSPISFVTNNANLDGGYAASLTQTGQVVCDKSREEVGLILSIITYLWVTVLVILHILLSVVLTSVGAIWIRNAKWVDGDNNKLVYSPNLMLAAMPVLAVGAAAEVAQHVFDNWLYLGLIPTYYLATFYGGLALGQSFLALGVWHGYPGCWLQILPLASVLSFVLISLSGVSCVAKSRRADNDAETAGADEDADLVYGDCIALPLSFILAFVTLGIATFAIFLKSKAPKDTQLKYLCIAITSLIIGVGSSIVLTATGLQWLHVPTAGGFLSLFLAELIFVKNIPGLHKDDNDIPAGEHTSLIV